MKLIGISIENTSEATYEEFIKSERAKSPLGELLIALVQETAWSNKYSVWATFDEKPKLVIRHQAFLPERSFTIYPWHDLSVRRVEKAVRAHLWKLHEGFLFKIAELQKSADNLSSAAFQIVIDKAQAAVVAALPQARGADYIPCQATHPDLYAFAQNGIKNVHSNPVYVVRVVDDEAVGGVARIESTVNSWYQMREEERRERFQAATCRVDAPIIGRPHCSPG